MKLTPENTTKGLEANRTYSTGRNQHKIVELTDGSRVELGALTTVQVDYTADSRLVTLKKGEGFFDVVSNANRPFKVISNESVTRAVGTAFNIRSNLGNTTVTVVEGTVEVKSIDQGAQGNDQPSSSKESTAILNVGEMVEVHSSGKQSAVTAIDPLLQISWRDGQLTFTNRFFEDVVSNLNRYSDKNIVLTDDSLKRISFSGVVRIDAMNEWLEALPDAFDVEIEHAGNTIEISQKTIQ